MLTLPTENKRLYDQAIKRLLKNKAITAPNDTYNAISSLEQEIEYYRSKIQKMK